MTKNKLPNFCRAITLLILVSVFYGCAQKSNPDIRRGSNYNFIEGYPEIRFSAIGFLNEKGVPTINVSANIVYRSLIYKEIDSVEQANISIDIRVVRVSENSKNNEPIEAKQYNYTFKKNQTSISTSTQNYFDFSKQIEVTPGSYKTYFTITDKHSGKKITRTSVSSIPNPDNNKLDLTNIRMLGKDMDIESPEWVAINTYDVPKKVDSLFFVFQVTNNNSEEPLTIDTELIRFESDTSIARPMYYNNYSPSSIQYQGIDYSEETIVERSQRRLSQQGSVLIEFRFARQERGNYRFQVTSNKEDSELYKARDFSIKSTNYPTLKTSKELARPLGYLMPEDEYEDLMSISSPDSLKKAIDRFWLKNIGDANKAASVLKLYYQRVEEANKHFSNFKEGWKTDTGMIYILFGPPWYVDERNREMLWSYSYNRNDLEYNYRFMSPRIGSEFFPFDHFILNRSQAYYNLHYRQVSRWTSGLILKGNL